MEVAPPPASGLRLQEVGDRLVVSFRPRRSGLVFLSIWLLGWTFGGVEAWLEVPKASPGGAAFLLFWLCGWFLGECAVICIIAWKLFGRVSLAVTPDEVEVHQELACFSWLRRYEAGQVEEIAVGRMPAGDDGLHKDYSLRLSCDSQPLWVGQGMGEREAEYVASAVTARIQRTSWWNDDDEIRRRPVVDMADRAQLVAPAHTRGVLLLAAVVAGVTLFGVPMLRRSQQHRTIQPAHPATAAHPLPAQTDFSNARVYARAVTSWALSSGELMLIGEPRCDAQATSLQCGPDPQRRVLVRGVIRQDRLQRDASPPARRQRRHVLVALGDVQA
jgi:hypothetical protein